MSMELDQEALKNKNKYFPKITIELEGEAVGYLLSSCVQEVIDPQKKEAEELWEDLLNILKIWTGVKKGKEGKPPTNRDIKFQAAWLHYEKGLTWRKVADKLCPDKSHNHMKSEYKDCLDKFRKPAEKYFKDIEVKAHS